MKTLLPAISIAVALIAGAGQMSESRAGAIEYDFRPPQVRTANDTQQQFLKQKAQRNSYKALPRARDDKKSQGRTVNPSMNDNAMNSIRKIR